MKSSPHQQLNKFSQFARQLASEHISGSSCGSCYEMQKEFSRNIKKLRQIYQRYQTSLTHKIALPPASEWLVDNMYLINEQIQYIRRNFPKSYCKKLPSLIDGPMRGYKRIYAIILELLEKTDGRCDPEMLKEFLWEYQTVQPLTMGELWAVPIVFRMAIIHRLRGLFETVNQDLLPVKQANIFKRIAPLLNDLPTTVHQSIRTIEQRMDLTNPTVLVYLAKHIREYVESNALNRWVEARTATHNLSLIDLIEDEQRRQSQNRVSAGQLISSLRQISRTIWEHSFEELSLVELTLRQDPAGVYPQMDFVSRDILRHKLEKLALRWRMSELIIAEQIIKLAENANTTGSELDAKKHVGYYLVDEGSRQLPGAVGAQKSPHCHLGEKLAASPNIIYFSTLALLILFSMWAMGEFIVENTKTARLLPILALPTLVLSGEWAIRQLHFLLVAIFPAQRLLKMDFQKGVPKDYSTMVVIPTMLTSVSIAENLAHKLEIYYLANQDPNIYFALLTDFADANDETVPGEEKVVQAAIEEINKLNQKYAVLENTRFFLFHRHRLWNPLEDKWMGWERKRGKLSEFNALLCGENEHSFSHIVGNTKILPLIRYVITLDNDTQLPRDAAKNLIGALSHPLNRPQLDPTGKKVIRGYGLLQPKITMSYVSTHRSFYARIFGGQSGIDIYSGAVSDPYQDLFKRGIFTGKGIYDVRVFHQILGDRIPENMVLSHDLLEGSFIKTGLVTDIELIDDYPTTYLNDLERMHRWARGDWQLLPWLYAKVPNRHGIKTNVELDLICRWQIVDNLRRSLLNPSLLVLICAVLLNINQFTAIKWPLITIGAAVCLRFLFDLFNRLRSGVKLSHYFIRSCFNFIVLPHTAFKMIDAIIRTLYRLYFSRRHFLEWVTAEEAGKRTPHNFLGIFRKMLPGEGLILAISTLLWMVSTNIFVIAIPLIWLSSPLWVYLISRQRQPRLEQLNCTEQEYLRKIAWRTWKYFQETVTSADHDLPPDNLQIEPPNGLAHRTSPTNIGLYLCSIISARDLGYISLSEMLARLRRTVNTLKKLPRWNGHFYNWYDTESLTPLLPMYVSSVDSGNLVGYLFAAKQGVLDCLERPLLIKENLRGLLDIVYWEQEQFEQPLDVLRKQLEKILENPPTTVEEWHQTLTALQGEAAPSKEASEVISAFIQELEQFWPWLSITNSLTPAESQGETNLSRTNITIGSIQDLALDIEKIFPLDLETTKATKRLINEVLTEAATLAKEFEQLALEHDFRLLYDEEHRLFSIGYNVTNKQLDNSFYDLFASEMRQTSFVSIAMGQVAMEHWFILKRTMTKVKQIPTLVSWSGTMFEYFMPRILMPNYTDTLWDSTYRMVIRKQIAYARKKGIPWGISESGYALKDFNLNYQYQAFGVPGLGLKQGLEKDLVISPYATVLAALQAPQLAIKNLRRLEQQQALGKYGFYEAIDFTRERLPQNSAQLVVKSYMAHHQGMILTAITNLLLDNRWQKCFLSEPRIEATEPLLRERVPSRALILSPPLNLLPLRSLDVKTIELRTFYQTDTLLPEARILSNGRLTMMVSNSGSSFIRWKSLDLTKWIEDPVKDVSGPFYYIRNLNNDKIWSPTFHPCRVEAKDMKMEFSLGKVTFSRTDNQIHTTMEITVAPDLDAEIREITLTNKSNEHCLLEVTSFLELALASHEQFQAHPVFSKMFIKTEFIPEIDVLLAHRRSDSGESGPYVAYMMNVNGITVGALEFETDRSRFIGRGRSVSIPHVIQTGHQLSGTTGAVLDPIFSLRRRINLPPRRRARFSCITAVADTREQALEICRKLRYPFQIRRTFDLAVTAINLELNDLNISPQQANIYQWMASQLMYFNSYRQQRTLTVSRNLKGQSGLWAYGISGDYPIVSVNFNTDSQFDLAKTMLKALKYWAIHGLIVDLVFICHEADGYNQPSIEGLQKVINTQTHTELFKLLATHIFILSDELLPEVDRNLLASVSRIQLDANRDTLISQMLPVEDDLELPDVFLHQTLIEKSYPPTISNQPEDLIFFNGWGGFTPNGKEYLICLKANNLPPQPWINVLANPNFGFLLSESGSSYTWAKNSREFKVTPWSNDPILDPSGEIFYLRDEEDGLLWSVSPLPIQTNQSYTIRHSQGYSVISHQYQEIDHQAFYWTPLNDPVKIVELTLINTGEKRRKLSVTYYLEWVLGVNREKTYPYIVTEMDHLTDALLARNTYHDHFPDYCGFLNLWTEHPVKERSWTGNRHGFIGRNGSLSQPAGLRKASLDNQTGASFNPCGAIQLKFELEPNEEAVIYCLVGAAPNRITAQQYLSRYHKQKAIIQSRDEVISFWKKTLGQVKVSTPDPGFNYLINHWLLYQTLACRLWARSAFYQSGGAFGYRDQLQDVLALLHTRPDLTHEQILLHAAHQFQEGDVQHWWHQETGHGIRTRYSDDLLWLVYASCRYVEHTGDHSIWDQQIPFLTETPLRPEERERYAPTRESKETANLYHHCLRAIERATVFGPHSLPLIGGGDWNDGMNKIGLEGQGESLWLAWFLYANLKKFIPVCLSRGDQELAEKYRLIMDQISWAADNNGWDGQWYRRAYTDNGDPLGSISNTECQIDCIAQAWAVISEAAPEDKAKTAIWSLYHRLVLHDKAIISLLSPPFSQTDPSPGYIQAYPQGVRENGGQYTHGAIWAVIAWAKLGEGNLAGELFNMLNPIYHTQTQHEVQTYRVEPYVMAADVYSTPPYIGRGGWSWYTGSSGWMYQAGLEWILGIQRQGDFLIIKPCIPDDWPEYQVNYKFGESAYQITVKNPHQQQTGLQSLFLDGIALNPKTGQIPLIDDGKTHLVVAEL